MEQRLANSWKMTANEKEFIETALLSDLRVDGRRPFDYRKLSIKFGREVGSSEVQLGQTHVMGFVTAQLVQPYRDRPNEGSLSIYTDFSPMADPSFEPGRPGESAVELGRIIDRGLRESMAVDTESLCVLAGKLVWAIRIDLHILDNGGESMAVDTESLCVLAGKLVWAIRIDLHILDNGGNLVDASNIAALAALLTFRRPECTFGGEDGQEVIVHPPEVREPLRLIVHHLPIAVTFAFFCDENIVVIDPTHNEEAVMGGRMTVTVNTNSDVCAIQKAGGVGVMQSVVMQCLRVASVKAGDITSKIKNAVVSYNTERALRKIKRHSSVALDVSGRSSKIGESYKLFVDEMGAGESSRHQMERLKLVSNESGVSQSTNIQGETQSSEPRGTDMRDSNAKNFIGGPSSWDPYSKGIDAESLKASLPSRGTATPSKKQKQSGGEKNPCEEAKPEEPRADTKVVISQIEASGVQQRNNEEKSLKDAVKPKNTRKKKVSSITDTMQVI